MFINWINNIITEINFRLFNIDIFEDDTLADMAISNRRGYEETDPRYIEALKIIKEEAGTKWDPMLVEVIENLNC